MQGRLAQVVASVGLGALVNKEMRQRLDALGTRELQRRELPLVRVVERRRGRQQMAHNVDVAGLGGVVQRRAVFVVLGLHRGLGVDQEAGDLERRTVDRKVQRRHALELGGLAHDRRPRRHELAHRGGAVLLDRHDHLLKGRQLVLDALVALGYRLEAELVELHDGKVAASAERRRRAGARGAAVRLLDVVAGAHAALFLGVSRS